MCLTMKSLHFLFSKALEPKLHLGLFLGEISRSHTVKHVWSAGRLWVSDQLVAEAATYKTHNQHKRQKYLPATDFEPATPKINRSQTYAATYVAAKICIWPTSVRGYELHFEMCVPFLVI